MRVYEDNLGEGVLGVLELGNDVEGVVVVGRVVAELNTNLGVGVGLLEDGGGNVGVVGAADAHS